MKKGAKVALALGIVFTVLVVAPIATVYGFFYENSKNPIEYNDGFDANTFFLDTFANSVENTANDHKIKIEVTEQTLNDFLYSMIGQIDGFPKKTINQVYVQIKDGKYTFNIGVYAGKLFSTKIKIATKLNFIENGEGNKCFEFGIDNIKIARAGHLESLGFEVASTLISDDTINDALSDSGIHMKVSLADKKIIYSEADLVKDISKNLGKGGDNDTDLLINVLEGFLEKGYVDCNFEDSIQVYANLEPFAKLDDSSKELFDVSKEGAVNFTPFVEALPQLAADGIIDSDHYNQVFKYLSYGYNKVDDETKAYVIDKNFANLGIYENGYTNQTYPGIVNNDNNKLKDVVLEQTADLSTLHEGSIVSFMTEEQANKYIGGCGFVGYSYLLTNTDKTDVNYIAIDNFYCNLFRNSNNEGCFPLVAGLNFNGYETRIGFDLVEDPSLCVGYKMGFKVKDIYFGEYTTSNVLSDFLFKLMADNLTDDPTLQIDYAAKTISVDFTDALQQSTKDYVESIGVPQMQILGNGIEDNGQVCAVIGPKE